MDLYDDYQVSNHDNDEKEYYFDFIDSLIDSGMTKREILEEMTDELDISSKMAMRVLKEFYEERAEYDDDEEDDIVEDDDYSDGNTEN